MSQDTLGKFGVGFQTKALSALLTDRPFLEQSHDIIDERYFESDPHNWIANRILWYFSEYKDIPSMEVFKKEVDKEKDDTLRKSIILSLRDVYQNLTASDLAYIKNEFLTFCKNQELKRAILKAADLLNIGQYDGIKTIIDKAMHAGQERNYGHNWKHDIQQRTVESARKTVGTGWDVINQIMDGGLGGGELGVIVAPPGVGKSWSLSAIGKAALIQGLKVLHFTLELNQNYQGLRYDTLVTGIEPNQIKNHIDIVQQKIQNINGELIIKYFPIRTATTNTLRAHISRLESIGFKPDIIIVDYADLLRPTEKGDARYQDLGIIYEDLRGMAGELDIPIWTASQSQRSSVNADIIEGDKIAESFNKIMTADYIMSMSRKTSDKTSNTARFYVIKNRFGPDGLTFPATINFIEGVFDIHDENSPEGIRAKKQMDSGEDQIKTLLHKKMLEWDSKENDSLG